MVQILFIFSSPIEAKSNACDQVCLQRSSASKSVRRIWGTVQRKRPHILPWCGRLGSTKSQIKVALKHPQKNVSTITRQKNENMWHCWHWRCEWGFDIKVTLKENGQVVGCSRHENWGRVLSVWWHVKRNDDMMGCFLPGGEKRMGEVCVKVSNAPSYSTTPCFVWST